MRRLSGRSVACAEVLGYGGDWVDRGWRLRDVVSAAFLPDSILSTLVSWWHQLLATIIVDGQNAKISYGSKPVSCCDGNSSNLETQAQR